jgi:16S rRNA (guanine527-N7)-methyltransferase
MTPAIGAVAVSGVTEARLRHLVEELRRWNASINLVGRSTLDSAWQRHIEDSAQLRPLAPARVAHWLDLGSGAGFPGLVIGAILAEDEPAARVTLVESDSRKATFLRETARKMGIAVTVIAERAEAIGGLGADVISARALAPLDRLLPMAAPHLAPGGICLFPKGLRAEEELASARRAWSFSLDRFASGTDPNAQILRLKGLNHV